MYVKYINKCGERLLRELKFKKYLKYLLTRGIAISIIKIDKGNCRSFYVAILSNT